MRMHPRTLVPLLAVSALSGCVVSPAAVAANSGGASAPVASGSTPAPPRIHTSGIATWFGPGLYGRKTACGQTLTPSVVGLANRTLPCGTLVRVSYGAHVLTLPVLDRGPYSHIGADWDLTSGAAEALGISDTVRIHTRIVGSEPNTPELGLPAVPAAAALAGGASAG